LRREGWTVNHKRVYRLYREDGLGLRRKKPKRRRAAVSRQPRPTAMRPNAPWTMDFMSDALANGQKGTNTQHVNTDTRPPHPWRARSSTRRVRRRRHAVSVRAVKDLLELLGLLVASLASRRRAP